MSTFQDAGRRDACRAMRVVVIEQTIKAVETGGYMIAGNSDEQKVVQVDLPSKEDLKANVRANKLFAPAGAGQYLEHAWMKLRETQEKRYDTLCYTVDSDCIDVALAMQDRGLRPAVLNMTSSSRPGGGYRSGSAAQEESLFRRTDLFVHLEDPWSFDEDRNWRYPLPEYGAAYSPNVCVFRSCEAEGYAFLPRVRRLDFVACASLRGPRLIYPKAKPADSVSTSQQDASTNGERNRGAGRGRSRKGGKGWAARRPAPEEVKHEEVAKVTSECFPLVPEPQMEKTREQDMKRKMRAILSTALLMGHDSIVLSAFGCGAYRCPPLHVAKMFHSVLSEKAFVGAFAEVVFAIIEDHNSRKQHNPNGNLRPFQSIFGCRRVPGSSSSAADVSESATKRGDKVDTPPSQDSKTS